MTRKSSSPSTTWEPSFVPMVEMMQAESANHPQTSGSDVGYKYATINQHRLGAGEPIRVKQGQKVLMRLLNASATENVVLGATRPHLPHHRDGWQPRPQPEGSRSHLARRRRTHRRNCRDEIAGVWVFALNPREEPPDGPRNRRRIRRQIRPARLEGPAAHPMGLTHNLPALQPLQPRTKPSRSP